MTNVEYSTKKLFELSGIIQDYAKNRIDDSEMKHKLEVYHDNCFDMIALVACSSWLNFIIQRIGLAK